MQDQLERLLSYVPIGPRFSNEVLQTFLVLLKKIPPKGRKLLILASASSLGILESMDLKTAFEVLVPVPVLDQGEICAVLQQSKSFDPSQIETCAGLFTEGVGESPCAQAHARAAHARHRVELIAIAIIDQGSRNC